MGRGFRRRSTPTNIYAVSTTVTPTATSLTLSSPFLQTATTTYVNYDWRPSAAITGTTVVTGYGTTWAASVVGQYIQLIGSTNSYEITARANNTSLTIATATLSATPSDFILHPGARFQNGSTAVTGSGTNWTSAMVGQVIRPEDGIGTYYTIAAVGSTTSLTLATAYSGTTTRYYRYSTATATSKIYTDLAQEFNPNNASGHPVVVGLGSYGAANIAPKALTTGQMKAPWTTVGTQTMMCSDCHNTDAASPAAQGPHGSATQFMLRGPVTLWPPTGNFDGATLYNTTFCANCHTYTATNRAHDKHRGEAVTCYNCHILVPHGGKLGRLIGDGNSATFPARYAYQGNKANMFITGFTKAAPGSYSETNCGATCDTGKHPLTNGTQW